MVEKIKVGYWIPRASQRHLRGLAERDRRSLSAEIAWLIDKEWRSYVAQLGARRAQRAQRTRHEEQGAGGRDGNV